MLSSKKEPDPAQSEDIAAWDRREAEGIRGSSDIRCRDIKGPALESPRWGLRLQVVVPFYPTVVVRSTGTDCRLVVQ
ncbi:hypothetical protein Y032_0003g1281 [Ancylostoma ceylanicum]|uniref:Uncharacterized protein n=1 Tax=Ancylostoma ceylanicum TaxID=53326 RepID=A0A016VX09_9BILA|nr:hypothetical protein Y032_0003g1281 [Ancylostoma ceylanicum]